MDQKSARPKPANRSDSYLPYRERLKSAPVHHVAAPGHELDKRKPISPSARQAMIDRIDTGAIMARLESNTLKYPNMQGVIEPELTASQLASAKLILDRTLPTLQAIDHLHRIDDQDKMTEAEIMAKLMEELEKDPTMLAALGLKKIEKPPAIDVTPKAQSDEDEGKDYI